MAWKLSANAAGLVIEKQGMRPENVIKFALVQPTELASQIQSPKNLNFVDMPPGATNKATRLSFQAYNLQGAFHSVIGVANRTLLNISMGVEQ